MFEVATLSRERLLRSGVAAHRQLGLAAVIGVGDAFHRFASLRRFLLRARSERSFSVASYAAENNVLFSATSMAHRGFPKLARTGATRGEPLA